MAKVIAKGKYLGVQRQIEVMLEDGFPIIELDSEFDEQVQNIFSQLLEEAPAMGGSYHPPWNSLLAAYSVLESTFFDDGSPVEVEADGDIGKIPIYDIEGIVY